MKKIFFLAALLCASLMTYAIDSEYCAQEMSSGNTLAKFTWVTTDEGNVEITIIEALGGAASSTYFRSPGISLDKFTVGGEAASTYFTQSCSGNKVTLTLIDPANRPAEGTKIVVNAVIEYATSHDTNAWPTLQFEYSYGGVCDITSVLTSISLNPSSAYAKVGESITLNAVALDQMGTPMEATLTYSVEPADAGSFAGDVFTFAKLGAATVTVSSGEVSKSVTLYCVPSDNLALNKTVKAGYEPGNQGELSTMTVDGNMNTLWVTWADQPAANEWLYVDLEDKYELTGIDIAWGADYSSNYIVQVRDAAPAESEEGDDTAWETLATETGAMGNVAVFTPVHGAGRYVRFHSINRSANCIRMREFRVFGSEYVAADDTEKPIMGVAEAEELAWDHAVISVQATDNQEVRKFHVVDATNGIDVLLVPTAGNITLTGLTAATTYNLTITAIDAANNESENSATVLFTTPEHLLVPAVSAPVPIWPAAQVKSIFSDAYETAPASINSFNEGWWAPPTMTIDTIGGIDAFLHYYLYQPGMIGAQWAEVSVATMEKIHLDVFASAAGTVTFRVITAGDSDAVNGTKKTLNLAAGQWNSFDFDMADFGDHNWTRLFQYAIEAYEAGGLVGEHISVDNIYFYRTTALVDTEKPTNVTATITATGYFGATVTASATDNSGSVIFNIQDDDVILATGGGASGANVVINVTGLLPDHDYELSLVAKDEAGNEADPISLTFRTAVAPAPAPTPDFTGKTAVPVFCDALENNPNIGIGNWGQATQIEKVQLANFDNVYYCTNMNYLGWELTPSVNATGMEYVHVDFYASDMTSIQLTPISPGNPAKEGVYNVTLTANAWTSVNVPLSAYAAANIDWSNIFQFKFMGATPAGKELFIDNVYFFKENGSAIGNIEDGVKAQKVLENGQIIIIKNGVRYTVTGQVIR